MSRVRTADSLTRLLSSPEISRTPTYIRSLCSVSILFGFLRTLAACGLQPLPLQAHRSAVSLPSSNPSCHQPYPPSVGHRRISPRNNTAMDEPVGEDGSSKLGSMLSMKLGDWAGVLPVYA